MNLEEGKVKKLGAVVVCAAFVWGVSGCFFGTCGGGEEIDELSADFDRVRGTTRVYELERPDGVLRVKLTFDDGSGDWNQFATRSAGMQVMAFLSDLLVPSAHASSCAENEISVYLAYTSTWYPHGGEPEVLNESVMDYGVYAFGAVSAEVRNPNGTSLTISNSWRGPVWIELASREGDARTLELISYSDDETNRYFEAPRM